MNFRVDIGIKFGSRGMKPRPATKGNSPLWKPHPAIRNADMFWGLP
jgi:hypothetical protein